MVETASPVAIIAGGDLAVNMASFGRHLRAENLSPSDLPPVFVPLVMLVLQGLESDDLPRWLQGQVAGSPVRCGV